jgi:hypothetical protein
MRGAVQKLLVFALATGLVAGGPACPHSQMEPCSAAISHETKDVPIYADLNVDPVDDGSLQAELPAEAPHHDDGLCKKCCAICIGANLPVTALALMTLSASGQMTLELDDNLVARPVSTEPGIPKPL